MRVGNFNILIGIAIVFFFFGVCEYEKAIFNYYSVYRNRTSRFFITMHGHKKALITNRRTRYCLAEGQ